MDITFSGSPVQIRAEMVSCLSTWLSTVVVDLRTEPSTTSETPKVEKAEVESTPAPAVPATPAGAEVTATLLGTEIPKKVKSAGRDAIVALLAKYGAKKGSELKPEQYGAFYDELVQLA